MEMNGIFAVFVRSAWHGMAWHGMILNNVVYSCFVYQNNGVGRGFYVIRLQITWNGCG